MDEANKDLPSRTGRTASSNTQCTHALVHAMNRFTTNVSFCPPKPKEFERQMSTFAARALLGT
jgi:hypothetical protein